MIDQQLEPIAFLCENAVGHKYFRWKKPPSTYKPIALYTIPPQIDQMPTKIMGPNLEGMLNAAGFYKRREWVGLTKEEVETWELPVSPTVYEFAQFVEAKLKEKNIF